MPEDDNSLLSAIPTDAFVAELKKRDGIQIFDCSSRETYCIEVSSGDYIDECDSGKGPAQIIVVR